MESDRNKPLIVVVEDEPDNYEVILAMVEMWDYEAVGFVDGEEAVLQIPQLLPDLVLLDIRLPGEINGIEVLKFMKTTPMMMTIPVVMMTAFQMLPKNVAEILSLGADDFLFKPLPKFAELKARLDVRMIHGKLQKDKLINEPQQDSVFISYSRHDWGKYVKSLVLRLQNEGIDVWID